MRLYALLCSRSVQPIKTVLHFLNCWPPSCIMINFQCTSFSIVHPSVFSFLVILIQRADNSCRISGNYNIIREPPPPTTDPAPTIQLFPIVVPGRIIEFIPKKQLSPIFVGAVPPINSPNTRRATEIE